MKVNLDKMLVLVCTQFEGKFDKGGKPYFLHCLRVMQNLNSDDDELLSIAVGHDLIEDTNVTYADLWDMNFSSRIIYGIEALTKQRGETAEEYLTKVKGNRDAVLVKLADLQDNSDIRRLKGISDRDIERMKKYQWMYTELVQHRKDYAF